MDLTPYLCLPRRGVPPPGRFANNSLNPVMARSKIAENLSAIFGDYRRLFRLCSSLVVRILRRDPREALAPAVRRGRDIHLHSVSRARDRIKDFVLFAGTHRVEL